MNGFACKNEANVTAEDFFFAGIAKPGVINNTVGSLVSAANVEKIPGLNTLGVSFSRIDFKPGGLNPPHTHPLPPAPRPRLPSMGSLAAESRSASPAVD